MAAATPHPSEERRIAALRELELLDTPPEPIFDSITQSLALVLDVPIALISLVDCNRQWFKSRVGLEAPETPRELAFCAHAILEQGPLVVNDARQDPRFADNALVTSAPDIRFYAGMPIRAPEGLPIGTLCVIDRRPRELGERELGILRGHAALVERELLHRAAAIAARKQVEASRSAANDSESLFRSVFELAPIGIAIVDLEGRFVRVNRALCEIVGYSVDELALLSFQDITHPGDLSADLDLLDRLVAGDIPEYRLEKRYIKKSGAELWIHLTVTRRTNADGSTHSFLSIVEDIGARKAAEQQQATLAATLEREVAARTLELRCMVTSAQLRNEQLRTLSETTAMLSAANSIEEVAAILSRYLPKVFPGTAGALYCGGPAGYQPASHWGALPAGGDIKREECWALRRGSEYRIDGQGDPLRCPHCRHSERQFQSCSPVFALGECVALLSLGWDDPDYDHTPDSVLLATLTRKLGLAISNLRLREELRRQALHDPLTGLYNRRYLPEFMAASLAQCRRRQESFALLMVDLDHFKALNDRYCHDCGDRALVEVAALLKRSLRGEEAAFRYGGEEFMIVTRALSLEDARLCAERVRRGIAELRIPVGPNGRGARLILSASIGVAASRGDALDTDTLIARADVALYKAKEEGRDRVVCSDGLTLVGGNAA